jgi:hypothetical protein
MGRKPRVLTEDSIIDAGSFDPPGASTPEAAPEVESEELVKRGRGRPPMYDREDMIQVLNWYLANETPSFPLESFHKTLENWLGAETPSLSTVRRWLDELRQQLRAPQL